MREEKLKDQKNGHPCYSIVDREIFTTFAFSQFFFPFPQKSPQTTFMLFGKTVRETRGKKDKFSGSLMIVVSLMLDKKQKKKQKRGA